jgi:hypothetical protein
MAGAKQKRINDDKLKKDVSFSPGLDIDDG